MMVSGKPMYFFKPTRVPNFTPEYRSKVPGFVGRVLFISLEEFNFLYSRTVVPLTQRHHKWWRLLKEFPVGAYFSIRPTVLPKHVMFYEMASRPGWVELFSDGTTRYAGYDEYRLKTTRLIEEKLVHIEPLREKVSKESFMAYWQKIFLMSCGRILDLLGC